MAVNEEYIRNLKIEEVPWHKITATYGRATDFPIYLNNMWDMKDIVAVKTAINEIDTNIEHQGTLWHATPFAMIFLNRIFEHVLPDIETNEIARFIIEQLLDSFIIIAECYHDVDNMEHSKPFPFFSDMLKEQYLWSEEYDEEEDEIKWQEEDVFSDDLFYSCYYYSYQTLLNNRVVIEKAKQDAFLTKTYQLLDML